MLDEEIYSFWSQNSLSHIKPSRGGEFPEGIDMQRFYSNLYTKEKYGKVLDIGCGYGRMCKAFSPAAYLGIDYSLDAINKAKELNPEYKFQTVKLEDKLSSATTALLHTVCLHVSDSYIERFLKGIQAERIIITEVLGRRWRRQGNPPVFNRDLEDYTDILGNPVNKIEIDYKAYNDTLLSILIF